MAFLIIVLANNLGQILLKNIISILIFAFLLENAFELTLVAEENFF